MTAKRAAIDAHESQVRTLSAAPGDEVLLGPDLLARVDHPTGFALRLQLDEHPRGYGAFARVLGHYVREEGVLTLEEAVRKMTSLPAWRIGQPERVRIAEGMYADIVVFDPARIRDRATFADPHQFAVGVEHVLVNGVPVIVCASLTGEKPGRVLTRGGGSHTPRKSVSMTSMPLAVLTSR